VPACTVVRIPRILIISPADRSLQSRLRALKVFDFGDLLLYTLRLFRQHPEVLESYRNQFRHILVDEFQDVSPAQVTQQHTSGPEQYMMCH